MAIILDCLRNDQPTAARAKQKFKVQEANRAAAHQWAQKSNSKNTGVPPAATKKRHPETEQGDTLCYLAA
ncbi:MAG TPA: hypothetical protein VNV36_09890 [Pseudomonas sp.]|uniref:hypothetical protein n=1 Tax=Pseudomonas sp. TaxID=306 RepID=UPI002CFA29DB|nr:hypothetical protein [Pseudomonas sp.]HWH87074.1 hypothetical protein [Pseudomonas sp.]